MSPIGDDDTATIGTSVPVFGTKNLAMHCTAAYRASVCTAFAKTITGIQFGARVSTGNETLVVYSRSVDWLCFK